MSNSLIRYDRSDAELEHFLFFTVAVAGKTGLIMKEKVKRFFAETDNPFAYLVGAYNTKQLRVQLRRHKLGQYNKLTKFVQHIRKTNLNPRMCSLEDLEACPGIGPKTARFFLIYTRPDQNVAVLDTHILAELRDLGYKDIPLATPQNRKRYKEIEQMVLDIAKSKNLSPVDYDDEVWRRRSWKPQSPQPSSQEK